MAPHDTIEGYDTLALDCLKLLARNKVRRRAQEAGYALPDDDRMEVEPPRAGDPNTGDLSQQAIDLAFGAAIQDQRDAVLRQAPGATEPHFYLRTR
jgi:hypothetical protein